jgi:hypothetical protein
MNFKKLKLGYYLTKNSIKIPRFVVLEKGASECLSFRLQIK